MISLIFITVNDEKIIFQDGDFEKDILLADVFFGGEVVIDETFENGDDEYYLYLRFSPDDLIIDTLIKKNGVGVNNTVLIDDFYRSFSKFSDYFNSISDKLDTLNTIESKINSVNIKVDGVDSHISGLGEEVNNYFSTIVDNISGDYSSLKSDTGYIRGYLSENVNDKLNSIESKLGDGVDVELSSVTEKLNEIDGKFDNINIDLSPVTEKLNEIDGKFDDINIDLSPVTEKLNDIDEKFDILKVINVSEIIDEKLSQLFAMKSLNGSNGSKFKDGVSVTVKGYDGNWIVEGSYPMLNADNVTIIVYKLKQNDMVLLAPAPFVEKV